MKVAREVLGWLFLLPTIVLAWFVVLLASKFFAGEASGTTAVFQRQAQAVIQGGLRGLVLFPIVMLRAPRWQLGLGWASYVLFVGGNLMGAVLLAAGFLGQTGSVDMYAEAAAVVVCGSLSFWYCRDAHLTPDAPESLPRPAHRVADEA